MKILSKKHSAILSAFTILLFAGQGCFGGGGGIDTSADGGVWKTVDGGQTFAQSILVPTAGGVVPGVNLNILTFEMDPSDHNAIYAGTQSAGLIFSYDAGASWQCSQDPSMRAGAVSAIAVDPSDKCRIYVARGSQIVRSDDCSRNYDKVVFTETKAGVAITGIEIDWFNPNVIYTTSTDGSVRKSSDRGADWSTVYRAPQAINDIILSTKDSRVILVGLNGRSMVRSRDAGGNWEIINEQFQPYRDSGRVIAFTQDKSGDVMYAATRYGIFGSNDLGITWGPLQLLTAPSEVVIDAIAVDPLGAGHILYSVGSNLIESRDGGANWSVVQLPSTRHISDILFDPENSANVYLGMKRIEK